MENEKWKTGDEKRRDGEEEGRPAIPGRGARRNYSKWKNAVDGSEGEMWKYAEEGERSRRNPRGTIANGKWKMENGNPEEGEGR